MQYVVMVLIYLQARTVRGCDREKAQEDFPVSGIEKASAQREPKHSERVLVVCTNDRDKSALMYHLVGHSCTNLMSFEISNAPHKRTSTCCVYYLAL